MDSAVTDQGGGDFLYEFEVHNTTDSGSGEGGQYVIVDWELPIFSPDDIQDGSIMQSDGWAHEVIQPDDTSEVYNNGAHAPYGDYKWDYDAASDPLLASDPDLYGPNPEAFNTPNWIIHWYLEPVCRDSEPSGQAAASINVCDSWDVTDAINPEGSLDGFSFLSGYDSANAPYLSSWYLEPPVSGDPPSPDPGFQGFGTPNSPARQAAQGITGAPAPGAIALMVVGFAGLAGVRRKFKNSDARR